MDIPRKGLLAVAVGAVSLLLAGAVVLLMAEKEPPRTLAEQACELGSDGLALVRSGVHPERSGDLVLAVREGVFIDPGDGPGGPSGLDPAIASVPIAFYGPERIEELGPIQEAATHADVAPTIALLLKGSIAADGSPLAEVAQIDARSLRRPAPRVIVTVVWRAGGWSVLEQWPGDLPHLLGLLEGGVSYEGRAGTLAVGPSVAHATLLTGRVPARHGVPDEVVRGSDGAVIPSSEADLLEQALRQRWMRQQPDALTGSLPVTEALESWSERGWGSDNVPDLPTVFDDGIADAVDAHGVDSEETNAALIAADQSLGELLRRLDAEVGAGRYVVAFTADGGRHLEPDDVPSVVVPAQRVAAVIEEEFGDVVSTVAPTQVFLEQPLVEGVTVDEIAAHLARLKVNDVSQDRQRLGDEYLFTFAAPKTRLGDLSCDSPE